MLLPIALFLAASSPGVEALKSSATAFHEREAAAEGARQPAGTDVLAAATRFQHDLRDWIALELPQEQKAIGRLRTAGILAGAKGRADTVEVLRPKAFAEAILVRIALHVPGGTDSAAWLYEQREGKWVRTLSLERGEQRNASQLGAIAISPGDNSGSHLLVAFRMPVSDSGCWHPVSFQLYRVGTPTPPPLLMDDWHAANLCDGTPEAKADTAGFTLELKDRDLSPGTTRTHVLRYELVAEHPRRVAPVALGPREFVHEWIESDWKQAIDWTAPAARKDLQKLHDQLRGAGPPVSGEYRSVTACAGGRRWDVALDVAGRGSHRFVVADEKAGNGDYQLLSAGGSGCGAR